MSNVKELLQSKNFKKRLGKWIAMYVGVMCLLAIVVTYSRYVSTHMASTSARAAKFDVKINQEVSCQDMASITPNTVACFENNYDDTSQGLRAKPQIGFYFTVDTRDLEVSSKLVITTTIKKNEKNYFTGYQLYDVTNLNKNNGSLLQDATNLTLQQSETDQDIILEYMDNHVLSKRGKYTYLLLLDYDYTKYKYSPLHLAKGEISVGYSAIQID